VVLSSIRAAAKMGQTGSRVMNKISGSFSFSGAPTDDESGTAVCLNEGQAKALARYGRLPLVYSRRGSMYFDEDGDLAHEFYEEVKKRGGSKMKRVSSKNLIPQGDVEYQHPRLHVDFPIIMYQG